MSIRAHTRFLASDLLEGRGTGTRGEQLASAYIAAQLTRMGALPAVGNDFLVPVPLKRAVIDDAKTSAKLNNETFRHDTDFVWNTGGPGALHSFSGPLTFVGAPDSTAIARAPELKGRVAVILGAMGAAAGTFLPALVKAGATGVVLIIPDKAQFNLYVRSRGDSRYFVNADVGDDIWQASIPVIIAGPTLSGAIFQNGVPPRFAPVARELTVHLEADILDVNSANVAAIIKGADPKRSGEFVAYSAHYDHLGISTPENGDSIYNGFSDDAAGVAMLLAIGDQVIKQPPARSTLLLFFTGEERGLLGSSYFASQPSLPLNKIVALINLDAGAPPAPPIDWRIAGGNETPLGTTAKTILATRKWEGVLSGSSPNSDYWPFLKRGVPAIFVVPGNKWENTTAAQQKELRDKWDHYHQANDEWKADFPFVGLKRYAEVALTIGTAIANSNAAR